MSKVFESLVNAEEVVTGDCKPKMIFQKIVDVMRDCPAIAKDSKNQQQGFKYRGIDAVMNTLNPLFRKHGVFVVPFVTKSLREDRQTKSGGNLIYTTLDVEYRFYAVDGSYVTACVHGEGMDSADKSSNKAMSVAYKYACFQALCIPTDDFVDPDAESPEESVPVQRQTAREVIPMPTAPPEPAILCELCGEVITPTVSKGVLRTPSDISKATGGKCAGCYKLTRSSADQAMGGNE